MSENPPQLELDDFGSNYTEQFIVGTIGALIGSAIVVIAIVTWLYFFPPTPTVSKEQLKSEYYRGSYDTCVFANYQFFGITGKESEDTCNLFVDKIKKDNWFDLDSKGWNR